MKPGRILLSSETCLNPGFERFSKACVMSKGNTMLPVS